MTATKATMSEGPAEPTTSGSDSPGCSLEASFALTLNQQFRRFHLFGNRAGAISH